MYDEIWGGVWKGLGGGGAKKDAMRGENVTKEMKTPREENKKCTAKETYRKKTIKSEKKTSKKKTPSR